MLSNFQKWFYIVQKIMYFHKEAEQSSISGVNCDLLEHLCS